MRIIFDITLQELKLICRDKTFHVLAAILILLTGYTLVVSNRGYQSAHSQHQHLTDTVRHLFENQKSGSAHMAGHYGHIVFKPATYLQAIEPGVTPFTGTTVRLEAHKQNEAVFSPASGQSSLVRFGEFSFALLLQLVFPLMILFTCYRSIVSYRNDGTLKILLSQGASMRKLIIGKILAYTAIYWSFLLIAAVSYSTLYSINGGEAGAGSLRTILLLLVHAFYYLILISITVYFSARTKNASGLLAGLIACWFILTIVIPKTAANLGSQLHPLPTRQMLSKQISEKKQFGINGHDRNNKYTKQFIDSVLQAYNVTDEKQLPFKLGGLIMQADENFNYQLYDEALLGIDSIIAAQNRIGAYSSLFNPFLAVKHLSMAAAGTDMFHHFHFTKEVEQYRRDLLYKINQQDAARTSQFKDKTGRLKSEFWKQTNDYTYVQPSIKWSLKNYQLEILGILGWMILTGLIIWRNSNKINVA